MHDGKTGFLLRMGEREQLSDLKPLIENDRRTEVAKAGRKALKEFTSEEIAKNNRRI
ncbi:MAG: hypothetical protein ACLR6J_14115 [Parabacteroides merdae]